MTHFAERLVARGAGLADTPGLALLRDEPGVGTGALTPRDTGSERPDLTRSRADRTALPIIAPIRPTIDADELPTPPPRVEPGEQGRDGTLSIRPDRVDDARTRPPSDDRSGTVAAPDRETVIAARAPLNASSDDVPIQAEPVEGKGYRFAHAVPASHPSRSLDPTREGRTAAGAQDTPPSISIGRIDVQFVQPPPVAPTRPPIQRARGFDGYARARRGEPR